jgi:hypothetical protein
MASTSGELASLKMSCEQQVTLRVLACDLSIRLHYRTFREAWL